MAEARPTAPAKDERVTPSSLVFRGYRLPDDDVGVEVEWTNGAWTTLQQLELRLDLYNHSPTGFEWGYGGSGPAQLALAICAAVLKDDQRALRVYQEVKSKLIATIDGDEWTITEEQVRSVIAKAEASHG